MIQPRMIVSMNIKPSTQYEGVFEIAAIDEKGGEYYFVGTPCGRILLRPSTVSTETV